MHLFFPTLAHMLPRLWLNHPWRKAQTVKLIIMQCFPLLFPLQTSQHLSNSSLGTERRDLGVSDRIIQYPSVVLCLLCYARVFCSVNSSHERQLLCRLRGGSLWLHEGRVDWDCTGLLKVVLKSFLVSLIGVLC